jgi:hypothetical protein
MPATNSLASDVSAASIGWGPIFAVGYIVHGPTSGHPTIHVFGGFVLGKIAMYVATRICRPS